MKSDSQLQRDVMEELRWEPRVDHAQIGVAAEEGVITLTGFVPDYAQKLAAENAARRVAGVKAIAEEIKVRFASDPKTADSEIAQRILDLFRWDVTIPDADIGVKVEHGRVTLTGKVDWNFQKQTAARAAGRINGVTSVIDLVQVKARVSSSDIRERIMSAFKRSSALDADAINISVEGNTVTLSGRVNGWNERKVAENAAWSAPGVARVEDDFLLTY